VTERARVLEIHETSVTLECVDQGSCESCNSMFCNVKARTYEAAPGPDMQLEPGDQVEVHIPPSRAIWSGFLVLIFPLMLFIAVYLAFGFLDNEPVQVGAGLGGLFAGFGLVYLFGRGRRNRLPQISRVFTGPDSVPVRINDTTL
jgi:positive regulator of sigma E activity